MALLVYLNTLEGEFIRDDYNIILNNAGIAAPLEWESLLAPLNYNGNESISFRPLTNLSFITDYRLWGFRPIGFHLTNLAGHIAATLLVLAFTNRILVNPWAGLFTALFFALHPVHTEAVAWVSGRADVWGAVFYFLAFYLYIRDRKKITLVLSGVSYVLALSVKETAITLPFLLMFWDYFMKCDRRSQTMRIWGYIAFLWLSIIFITIHQALVPLPFITIKDLSKGIFFFPAIIYYLKVLFYPVDLNSYIILDYPRIFVPALVGGLAAVFIPLTILIRRRQLKPRRAFLGTAFFLSLLPLMDIFPVAPDLEQQVLTAERFLYLPSAFFLALAVKEALGLARRGDLGKQILFLGFTIFLIGAFYSLTWERNETWRSARNYYQDALRHNPQSPKLLAGLGVYYLDQRQYREAQPYLEAALKREPSHLQALAALSDLYWESGQTAKARALLLRALRYFPRQPELHFKLGMLYHQLGLYIPSVEEFYETVRLAPDYFLAYYNLGYIYQELDRPGVALIYYKHAYARNPYDRRLNCRMAEIYGWLQRKSDQKKSLLQAGPEGSNPCAED